MTPTPTTDLLGPPPPHRGARGQPPPRQPRAALGRGAGQAQDQGLDGAGGDVRWVLFILLYIRVRVY